MLKWFRGRSLDDILNETKTVKVHGAKFTIRKVNVLNYLDGSKVLRQAFDTYQSGKTNLDDVSEKKVKEHFAHVLVAGLVDPALSFKEEQGKILVDKLFTDWDLVGQLYEEIMNLTYGKKKAKLNTLAERNL